MGICSYSWWLSTNQWMGMRLVIKFKLVINYSFIFHHVFLSLVETHSYLHKSQYTCILLFLLFPYCCYLSSLLCCFFDPFHFFCKSWHLLISIIIFCNFSCWRLIVRTQLNYFWKSLSIIYSFSSTLPMFMFTHSSMIGEEILMSTIPINWGFKKVRTKSSCSTWELIWG